MKMKTVVLSLLVGCLVGAIYGLLKVRSPAPPVIALIGLLGILIGEHLANMVRAGLTPAQVITFQEQEKKYEPQNDRINGENKLPGITHNENR